MKSENQKIRFVDGFKIRNLLEDDFGIVETSPSSILTEKPKFWIPKDEVWIDHPYRDEAEFLAEMNDFTFPTDTETYEMRREMAKDKFCTLSPDNSYILRSEEREEIIVHYVDGGKVRRMFDPEFTLGGHDLVYSYISSGEIWLDNKMDEEEIPFILLHEEVERKLMTDGKPYHIAHEYAIVADKEMRRIQGVGHYPGDPEKQAGGQTDEEFKRQLYVE